MSYADQPQSKARTAAIVLVILLHLVLGYALVTGLAFNVIKKAVKDLKTFDVKEAVPPPPPPPPPVDIPPPPVVVPPPIVQTVQPPPMIQVAPPPPAAPPPAPVIHVDAKPQVAKPAVLRGDANFGITNDDYPSDAQRNNEEGVTRFTYDITADGRMANCHVTGTSGSSSLDTATCTLATRRARWKPAQDASGNPIETKGLSRSIRWQIPKD
jgi:protein TonB